MPWSSALMPVHLPVPFWPAVSRIFSTSGAPSAVAVQLGFFPVVEDGVHVVVVEAEAVFEDLVGFADELHVAVFDAVMHHFDEVPGAVFADPVAAGFAVFGFGGYRLQDGFDVRPGVGVAAGHDGRPVARAFFAAGDANAEVADALFAQGGNAAVGVGVVAVAAVDNDVAGLQIGQQLGDGLVYGISGAHHQHDDARFCKAVGEFLQAVGAADLCVFGGTLQEGIDFVGAAVVGDDFVAVVVHVEDEVLPHDGEADDADVCFFHVYSVGYGSWSAARRSRWYSVLPFSARMRAAG